MGKRGPKSGGGKREASGRLSRKPIDVTTRLAGKLEKQEREVVRTGVEARHRVFGIGYDDLMDQRSGSCVGRWRLAGLLTEQQAEAADAYFEAYRNMQMAIPGPGQPQAVNLNATRGLPGAENVTRSQQSMAAWKAVIKAIQDRQNELRGNGALIAALDYCVLQDMEFTHMLEWLREGLNALAKHFKIGDRRKPPVDGLRKSA